MKCCCIRLFINLFFIVLPFHFCYAQELVREPSSTRYIKDFYEYVSGNIKRNQYYVNEIRLNSNRLLWSDNKIFHIIEKFHYSYGGDHVPSLRMITLSETDNKINYYYEFLYDTDGKLIYCFEKQNDTNTFTYREFKVYYEKSLCINLVLDKEIIDSNDISHNDKINRIYEEGTIMSIKFKEVMEKKKK